MGSFREEMKKTIASKIEIEGGGGVTRIAKTSTALNSMKRLYSAELVIYLNARTGKVHVGKNRYSGKTGDLSTKEIIDILVRILVRQVFGNRMTVFQEAMKRRLKGAIKKIVKEGA